MTRQSTTQFEIRTSGKGLYDFTRQVEAWMERLRPDSGLLTLFCRHTSASLVIQENADPSVTADLKDFFERLVPEDARLYRHTAEGPDDMTSHIRTALTQTSLAIPVHAGRLMLGTWQGIYLFEHREIPHRRGVAAHMLYESLHGQE